MLDENVTNLIFIMLQFISFLRDIVSKVSAILFQEITDDRTVNTSSASVLVQKRY